MWSVINMAIPISINGNRIKRLREQKGWSLKELAVAVKLSESEIYRAEEGGRGLSAVAIQRLKIWADEVEKFQTTPIQLARQEMAAMKEELMREITMRSEPITIEEKKPSTFGNELRKLREENGFSMYKVAQVIGVTPSSIKLWEIDRSYPEPKNLKKIAALYNVKLAELKKAGKQEVTVSLSQKDHDKLVSLCKSQGTTKSNMISKMIKRYK
jgi:transcriptional regulator with XRE-family HTH domain